MSFFAFDFCSPIAPKATRIGNRLAPETPRKETISNRDICWGEVNVALFPPPMRRKCLPFDNLPASAWAPITPPRISLATQFRPARKSVTPVTAVAKDPLHQPFFNRRQKTTAAATVRQARPTQQIQEKILATIDDLASSWEKKQQEETDKVVGFVKAAVGVAVGLYNVALPFVGCLVMEALLG
ncbi:hypothetical protein ABW20_dc0107845 [Dactylellina cionopaga]|nr:hypothetical protein ABW20_dc0107845 [Dactylellina cionopaga]